MFEFSCVRMPCALVRLQQTDARRYMLDYGDILDLLLLMFIGLLIVTTLVFCRGLLRFLFFGIYCTNLLRHHGKMAGRLLSSSSIEEVKEYLLDNGIDDEIVDNFRRNKVDGSALVKLTEEDVKELVPLVGV